MGQRGNLGAGYVYFTRVFLGLVVKVSSLRSPHISIDGFKTSSSPRATASEKTINAAEYCNGYC